MNFTIQKNGSGLVSFDIESGFDADELFERAFAKWNEDTKTNQAPFMRELRSLSAGKRVVEFGYSEGQSAFIFLVSRAKWVFSYDILPPENLKNLKVMLFIAEELGSSFSFNQANTAELQGIPECDVLLIDSLHTYEHVMQELKHADSVKETIIFHDTSGFPDVMQAVIDYEKANKQWKLTGIRTESSGIAFLTRIGITTI